MPLVYERGGGIYIFFFVVVKAKSAPVVLPPLLESLAVVLECLGFWGDRLPLHPCEPDETD